MPETQPNALLIVRSAANLTRGEEKIRTRLGDGDDCLGFQVVVKGEADATPLDVRDKALVIISSTVNAGEVGERFRDVPTPIIVSGAELFASMRMLSSAATADRGSEAGQTRINLIERERLLIPGITEQSVSISREQLTLSWIKAFPRPAEKEHLDVLEFASLEEDAGKVVFFGYRSGGKMLGMEAPAKRVGLPFDYDMREPSELTPQFWVLFGAAVKWVVGELGVRQFDEVFKEEWQEIQQRRELQYGATAGSDLTATGLDGIHAPQNLVGLALSGGGIRSATFCLGVLQGLNELKLLRVFDYLSTVSGGGYLGGWWSAWLSRDKLRQQQEALARQPGKGELQQAIFPNSERIEPERLDDYRWRTMGDKIAEGSLSAGKDPIHHLRLFANYLTPRKGSLSGDTWRAVAVISRNLLMTWLILLPMLVAFVLAGQLYFIIKSNAAVEFFYPVSGSRYLVNLMNRAIYASYVLLPLVGWTGLMYVAYMRSSASMPLLTSMKDWLSGVRRARQEPDGTPPLRLADRLRRINWAPVAHLLGGVSVIILIFFLAALYQPPKRADQWFAQVIAWWQTGNRWKWLIPWAAVAAILGLYTFPWRSPNGTSDNPKMQDEWRREVWRNKIVRVHSKLLVISVLTGAMLAFAGFGHEIFDYLWRAPQARNWFLDYVGKIGGWGALIGAIAGAIFTAYKTAPSAGRERGEDSEPSPFGRLIIAVTPLLVIIVLMIMASWVAHELLRYTGIRQPNRWPLTAIAFVGVNICLFFAFFEMHWKGNRPPIILILSVILVMLLVRGWVNFFPSPVPATLTYQQHLWLLRLGLMMGGIIVFRLALTEREQRRSDEDRFELRGLRRPLAGNRIVIVMWVLVCAALAWLAYWGADHLPHEEAYLHQAIHNLRAGQSGVLAIAGVSAPRVALSISAFTGILVCIFFVIIEMVRGRGKNWRSLVLIASVYLLLVTLQLISFYSDYTVHTGVKLVHALVGLIATILAWQVALGWMADPNTLSMHAFYKGRIVRAYLGASNPHRENNDYEIYEAVIGDDVLLKDLQNCQRGGPYHLLNTTLNLVGGRDLVTAQRSSAMFVLSKLYCGSFRTGFRRNVNYMDGRLSLGTAVAVSGAAVSPGMGSGKTTSSLAMLMTLMNVRLGYWAPTPSGDEWDSAQPRLWPFYMTRELLSQTSDLSSYCYLTDGGHFDNLGLYSLVERGCRYIVVADAVADPEPCFSDLGNAIRRCRIDFNADIDLDITPFIKQSKDNRFAKQHYVVGTITYSLEHAQKLGWEKTSPAERRGIIVYIKPSLLKNEKKLSADVRQYEIENNNFPQQSTVDQWFDEAQFESYRRLGEFCARAAFDKLKEFKPIVQVLRTDLTKQAKKKISPQTKATVLQNVRNLQKVIPATAKINYSQPLTPPDIEALFDYLLSHSRVSPNRQRAGRKRRRKPSRR